MLGMCVEGVELRACVVAVLGLWVEGVEVRE